jgi:hypothetical protein
MVLRVQLDLLDRTVFLDHREMMVTWVQPDLLDHKESKVCVDRLDYKAIRALQDLLDQQDPLDLQDPPAPQDLQDHKYKQF